MEKEIEQLINKYANIDDPALDEILNDLRLVLSHYKIIGKICPFCHSKNIDVLFPTDEPESYPDQLYCKNCRGEFSF